MNVHLSSTPPAAGRRRRGARWPWWVLRVVVTLMAFSGFLQAVLAGGFMQGHLEELPLHAGNAALLAFEALALIPVAVLVWRPGRGPAWPTAVAVLIFAAVATQMGLGFARELSLHVPLGVTIISGLVVLLIWSWSAHAVQGRSR